MSNSAMPSTAPVERVALPTLWVAMAFTVGTALGDALAAQPRGVQVVASIAAWAAWTAGLVAALVPRTASLTVLRILAPAALVTAAWGALGSDEVAIAAAGFANAAVITALAMWPGTAARYVEGSSYGEEHRFPLRAPVVLLAGPIPLAWLVAMAGALAGPLLLAAAQWVAGGLALALGLPAAAVAARALHGLSRRWLVLVPAGLVIHDHFVLAEPVLVLRRQVAGLRPAPADTSAVDLTAGAAGLALELDVSEAVTIGPTGRFGLPDSPFDVERILIAPTSPGSVLQAAADHRIPTG